MINEFETTILKTKEEIEKTASMPASSPEQNRCLKLDIESGNIKPEDCYILKYRDKIIGRTVIIEGSYLAYYTLEDISQESANEFLANVLKKYPGREFRTDLYSDKKNYELVYSSLLANGFKDMIHKESYTIKVFPVNINSKLTFKEAEPADEDLLVDLFMKVAEDNKDKTVLKEISEKGLYDASREFVMELRELNYEKKLWNIAYFDNKPAGFVIVQAFSDDDGGIGYIGVLPEYRGNHFSSDLLYKAINLASEYKMKKLIGDIDVDNQPMRNNLLSCGFKLDCSETVFFK